MKEVKILYFSDYEWGNMGRRKVRLAYEFARRPEVASLLFIEPAVQTSLVDVVKGRFFTSHLGQHRSTHLKALLGRPRQVQENVWIYTGSQKTVPLTRLPTLRRLAALRRFNQSLYSGGIRRLLNRLPGDDLVLWLNHPLHAWTLDIFPQSVIACYDWTDDWTEFEVLPVADRKELVALNDKIIRSADLVFAVSANLYRRAEAMNSSTFLAPNATGCELIKNAANVNQSIAPELSGIPRPRIGYIGAIGDRVDFSLLRLIAETRPEWSIVLIGPVWKHKHEVVEDLADLPNIHLLGTQPYQALPSFLRGLDVCTIPHTCDALTASMDPIKLYDYLATGRPIVSTPVAGVERFSDVVYIADDPRGFVAEVEDALREDGSSADRRIAYARDNTWSNRADQIWETLGKFLSR
jgi:glycosyltransferase involved in cell wall biosynthesis